MRFDVRTQNFRLLRKEISHDDLKVFLDELPDDAAEAVETETRFIASSRSTGPVADVEEDDED
jgi:hypothetical protein